MSLRILIVDDASFTRDLIKRTLKKQFPAVEIEDAVNGRKAQQILNRSQFDAILCDWEMPEMTGLELLKWCREQPEYAKEKVPFVMITSRGDKDHVVEAVQAGVTDYLGKPFSGEQLVNKVLSAAKKHKLDGRLTSKKPRESASSVSTASIDILMGAGKASKPVQATKFTHPDDPVVTVKDVKIPSMVRFESKQFRCMVTQFSKREATMFIKSDDVVPGVLGQAVLDLEFQGKVNRLNYFVQGVSTTEKKADSAFLTVVLNLIDQDKEKEDFISKLFDSL